MDALRVVVVVPRAAVGVPRASLTAAAALLGLLGLASCSPEARRVRDGGAGADPGNKVLIEHEAPDPHAADTTLWPGRATAPVDLLARGIIAPPTYPAEGPASPPSPSQHRTFDRGQPSGSGQRSERGQAPDDGRAADQPDRP